jgi:hypothetical protein
MSCAKPFQLMVLREEKGRRAERRSTHGLAQEQASALRDSRSCAAFGEPSRTPVCSLALLKRKFHPGERTLL